MLQIILLLLGYKEVSRNLDTVYKYKDTILIYNNLLMHIEKKNFSSEYLIKLKEKLVNSRWTYGFFSDKKISKLSKLNI